MSLQLFRLDDSAVVVTGGLGQLGLQYTRALRAAGARVAVLDSATCESLVRQRFGADAADPCLMFIRCDITSRAAIENALAQIEAQWGTPHGLVNNAALDSPPDAPVEENGPFETYPDGSWDKVMEVNVKGVFLACQIIGGAMARAGRGSIVNISSIYGVASPNQSIYEYRRRQGDEYYKPVAYSVSKSALMNLTRYLATYWARKAVRVNSLVLAGVYNNQDQRFLEAYCAHMPMGRMARPDEYNGAVIFLLSQASSYMTGATLTLDGGWTAW